MDPVERVIAAAAVPGELLLDPAVYRVDGGESEAHHMERIEQPLERMRYCVALAVNPVLNVAWSATALTAAMR